MDEETGMTGRSPTKVVLWHVLGFLLAFFLAHWLRSFSLEPDPVLQGYLQIIVIHKDGLQQGDVFFSTMGEGVIKLPDSQ